MAASNPPRLYLDSNIYDQIVGRTRETISYVVGRGRVKLYSSHITEDELGAMPHEKAEKQRALASVVEQLTEDVPSIPAVWGYTRFDRTLFGDDTSIAIYISLKARHAPRDAIHVATANYVGCDYFVTEDKDLRQDVDRLGLTLKPIGFERMITLLGSL